MPRTNKPVPKFLLTLKSSNIKTGPMAVSTSPMGTCPDACPFKGNGCYAAYGPVKIWWDACTANGDDPVEAYTEFLSRVTENIDNDAFWRHNQAGDLFSLNGRTINQKAARALIAANEGKKGYTYTHYGVIKQPFTQKREAERNRKIVEEMNASGFATNVSANSMEHADKIKASGIKAPIVTLLPERYKHDKKAFLTPGGNKIVACPAITHDDITCVKCKLCMHPERDIIVGFPSHGSGKRRAESVYTEWSPDEIKTTAKGKI
jgi:ferredoxin